MPPPLARAVVLSAALLAPDTYDQTFTGRVLAVHDGDTLTVQAGASAVRIRLVGIDCPEQGQAWGADARQYTSSLVLNKTVTVTGTVKDRFDRLLARVVVDGTDVNLAIVKAGMAWQYDARGRDRAIADAERDARLAARGLWSERHPEPPWRWRREHPRQGDPVLPSGPTLQPGSAATKAGTRSQSQHDALAAGPLHGNVKSRRFHRPGCPNYDCRNCTEQFLTEASAIEAGYEPAGDCRKE
jgi:micrococcal nuclease